MWGSRGVAVAHYRDQKSFTDPVIMYLVIDPHPVDSWQRNRTEGFVFFVGIAPKESQRKGKAGWGSADAVGVIQKRKDDPAKDYLDGMRERGVEPEVVFLVAPFAWFDPGSYESEDLSIREVNRLLNVVMAALSPAPLSSTLLNSRHDDSVHAVEGWLVDDGRDPEIAVLPEDRLFYLRTSECRPNYSSSWIRQQAQSVKPRVLNKTQVQALNDSGGIMIVANRWMILPRVAHVGTIIGVWQIEGVVPNETSDDYEYDIVFGEDTDEIRALRRSLTGKVLDRDIPDRDMLTPLK